MEIMIKEYKEFTEGTIRQKFKQCFKEGYRPLTINEALEYQNKSPHEMFTANAVKDGINIIITEKTNLDTFSGRVWRVGSFRCWSSLADSTKKLSENDSGRLVGVKEFAGDKQ